MSLTNPGDLYIALNDSIFPKIFDAIRSQRPSLLNYATPRFLASPTKHCLKIDSPVNGAPTFTELPAIQYPVKKNVPPIEFLLQITQIGVGFGVDTVGLPPELLPLPPQRIAVKIAFKARFAVPRLDPDSLDCPDSGQQFSHADFPLDICDCFDGALSATIATKIKLCGKNSWITVRLDRFDTSNLTPVGLRQTVDRLVVLILDTAVLPALWPKISPFVVDMSAALPPNAPIKSLTITPEAISYTPNPDIDAHLLKARFDLKVSAP